MVKVLIFNLLNYKIIHKKYFKIKSHFQEKFVITWMSRLQFIIIKKIFSK